MAAVPKSYEEAKSYLILAEEIDIMGSSDLLFALKSQALNDPIQFVTITCVLCVLSYFVANEYTRFTARLPGFTGPTGLPIIGNIWDIRKNAAEKYREWSKQYGGVYQIQLGNIPIVVVNDASAAKVIFGHNSQALASRPEFYTFHKVLSNTAGTTIGTSPYSDSLKKRRKGAASALNRPAIATYVHHLNVETIDFVSEFLRYGKAGAQPVDPTPMIQRLSLSLALTLNWGVRVATQDEDIFREITHVEEEISKFRSTTGNLQDYIPLLRLNKFSFSTKKAAEMRDRRDRYLSKLNNDLDDRIAKGTHNPCIQANVILDPETKLNKEELTSISLTMLSGGLDTITTLLQWSIALLASRPDIQAEAVQAIREHFSEQQPLCDAEDDQKCQYIVALVRECLRYFTVLRLALPRASVKKIKYQDTVIPTGTWVFLNAWACNMDPAVWTDPETFRPQRWLEQPDAPLFTYGLGYRMCAGSLLANRELYLIFMRLLNSFRIEKVDDIDYHPVLGNSDPTSLVAIPKAYRARFVPYNEAVLEKALST